MTSWYVLQVLSGKEGRVKQTLEEQAKLKGMEQFITEVLLPTEKVSEYKQGEQKIIEKKLWPGYLLINMVFNDDSWQYVKSTNGVVDFLGGAMPTALTQREVDEILTDLKEKKETVKQKHQFSVGDVVKIIEGPFINFIGTITEVSQEKGLLSVLVTIFGRDTHVEGLKFTQVEETNDEGE